MNSIQTKLAGTSLIFVNQTGQVLLLLRDDKPQIRYPNCWDIPGGGIEGQETPETCIRREMREEMDLAISPVLFRVYDMPDRTEHTFWQHGDFDLKSIKLGEGQKLQWFTEEEIMKMPAENVAFGFKPILMEFFQERPFSESKSSQ